MLTGKQAARRHRLSERQVYAVKVGGASWQGARESGVTGDTMAALERRGLAEVRQEKTRSDGTPYGRCLYRLTNAGAELRLLLKPLDEWSEEELIAAFIEGTLSHDDYVRERDRRAAALLKAEPGVYLVALRIDRGGVCEEFACGLEAGPLMDVADEAVRFYGYPSAMVHWRSNGEPTPAPAEVYATGRPIGVAAAIARERALDRVSW